MPVNDILERYKQWEGMATATVPKGYKEREQAGVVEPLKDDILDRYNQWQSQQPLPQITAPTLPVAAPTQQYEYPEPAEPAAAPVLQVPVLELPQIEASQPYDPAEPPTFEGEGIKYPLAESMFVRPILASAEAAIPGARRGLLELAETQPGVEKGEMVQLAERIEQMPWYQKMPEAYGWGTEKFMEYKFLKGLFKYTGLNRLTGIVGIKLASKIAGKELTAMGGKVALTKTGAVKEFVRRWLTAIARTAPSNVPFLSAWSASEAARRGEPIAPAAKRGALWGLGLSVGISAVTETTRGLLNTRTATKVLAKLQTKYPRIADYLAGEPEQAFVDEAMKQLQKEGKIPYGMKITDLPNEMKSYLKAAGRVIRKQAVKFHQRQAATEKYWEAPGPKEGKLVKPMPKPTIKVGEVPPKAPIITPQEKPAPPTEIAKKEPVRPVAEVKETLKGITTPKAPEIEAGKPEAITKAEPTVEGEVKLPAKVAGMGYLLDDGTILKDMGAASHINLVHKIPEGKKVVDAGFLDKEGNYLMRDDVIKKGKTYSFVEPNGTVVQAKIIADDVDPEMLMDGITIEIPSGKFDIEREQLLKPVEEQFKDMLEQWETSKSMDERFGSDYAGPKPILKPLAQPAPEEEAATPPAQEALGKEEKATVAEAKEDIITKAEREQLRSIGMTVEQIAKTPVAELRAKLKKPKTKGATGAIGDIGEVGATGIDTGRIKVSMEPGAKPQTAGEIIDYMSRAFGITIRGKATHHIKALGWFDPKAIGVRMRDVRSLTTGTHEVAHHIDWTLNNRMSLNPPTTAIGNELLALGKELYGSKKPKGGYKSEGWAEFVREYLTGEEAKEKAPNLYEWFTEKYLPSNKDMAKKIAKTRDMITKWRLQGAETRVDSQINKKQVKWPPSEWFKRGLLWVETSFRDEFAPIKRAMIRAGIREGELTPAEDPYQIAVARADKAGAIARQFVLEYTTDMAGNRTGKGLREILKPVAKDINAFTRWIITARARLLHSKGINPGISKVDANYVYEKYDNELWQDTLKELTDWNHRVLDYLVEAGGLDTEAANTIKNANPIYIPFMRAFKEGELRIGGGYGKGVAKVTKPIKKIKGSGREIIDPIESMIKQTQKVISVAHKAEIAKALAKLATKKGMASMIWKVPAPKQATRFEAEQLKKDIARIAYERMGLDPQEISSAMLEHWDDVLTVYSNAGQYYGKDNIVALVIDGKREWYEVDPALYKAIEGVDQYALPWFLGITFGKATRMVRLGATGLNPPFGLIRNFIRDAGTFTVLSKHAKAGPLSAIKGIAEDIINTQAAMKFKAMGGKMSSQILADRRAVQHLKKHALASTVSGKTIYTVAHPIDALRELFGLTEAGTRIGEYGPALKAAEKKYGKGSKDAAIYALNQAQDVTTNFSRHGKIAKVLNQTIPFFNAAIQGPDKIVRTFSKRPIETSLKAIIALTIPAIWLWWKYKDEEWYKNMPEYERVNYLHFRIPFTDVIIRLPVPFELGHFFQSAPIAALDALYRKDPKIVNKMFEESLRQANPFDWPALFSPIIDIMANEDFAGKPIVSRSAESKLPEDQYGNYTTELMKIIGKAIGYSPAKLEHLVASYSGGLYTRVARTIDLGGKEEITKSDMPVIGTLFLRDPYAPKASVEKFYAELDRLDRMFKSRKLTEGSPEYNKRKYMLWVAQSRKPSLSNYWKLLQASKTVAQRKFIWKQIEPLVKSANAYKGKKKAG